MEKEHPPSTRKVIFYVKGEAHIGFYLKKINKYVTNVNRWKDTDSEQWFDDEEVDGWDPYFSQTERSCLSGRFSNKRADRYE